MSVQKTIEELASKRVKDDPKLVQSAKRLAEFKLKPSELAAEIQKLEAELVEKEKQIAAEMLAGGAASVGGLSALRERIADLREESRILQQVISQATSAHEQLKEEFELDRRERCRAALKEAMRDLVDVFENAADKLSLVKQAAHLTGSHWLTSELQDFERLLKNIAGRVGEATK